MKHAYLIIAHNNWSILQQLLNCLDDERNDIYIHIDKKVIFAGNELKVDKSHLYILPVRLDVRWGDYSMVKAEILLFEEAYKNGFYAYYHLLSGADLAIKPQDYIHDYCDLHQGVEFIGYASHVPVKELLWQTQHYFLFTKDFQSRNLLKRIVRALFVKCQDLFSYKRSIIEIKKGSQWCSITHDFVIYILQNKDIIYRTFNHTYCPDELFIQTLCWNSEFRERIYSLSGEFEGCLRYIKWENGALLPLELEDVEKMVNSDRWFARKVTDKNVEVVQAMMKLL